MDTEVYRDYEFGVGGIDEVLSGMVDRVDSFDDVIIPAQKTIILPKIIGVYQSESRFTDNHLIKLEFDESDNQVIYTKLGNFERINPDLICMIYDPSNISHGLLKNATKRDILGRLKLVDSVNTPDFYKKNVPEPTRSLKRINDENESIQESIIDRDRTILKMTREDFGLTRYEAVELLIANNYLNRPIQSDTIITRPSNMVIFPNPEDFGMNKP